MRNQFWKIITLFGLTLILSWIKYDDPSSRQKINFNQDWKFKKQEDTLSQQIYTTILDESLWEQVSLPHTASIEPLITGQQWQGNCWYRKTFKVEKENKGKHIALYFEGAMQVAEVWLNSKKIAKHEGGYLPFYVNLTGKLHLDKENEIAIKLNNDDNIQIPPGKVLAKLDFNWYSGLYRNVYMIVKDQIHITNPIQTDIVAGGGVFVKTLNVNKNEATLNIRTDILNESEQVQSIKVKNTVYTSEGILVSSSTSTSKQVSASQAATFEITMNIKNPKLWSPETPNLYTVNVEVINEVEILDTTSETFGVRSIKFDKEGFYLNGEKYNLRGTNRHQEYPYIGYALSDNAQYRDAYKIKEAGFNFVRLSHYPQSKSFMKACDELGIMVMDAIPGWQFFGDETFQENCFKDIRQLVRRDRNHPSVILWEASLNESGMTEAFMDKAHAVVHEEFPGEQVYTCGWMDYGYDVFIPARQHSKAPHYWKKYNQDKPIFIAEYGDWEYYAQNAGFNQTAFEGLKENERTSRQLRGDGQLRLAQQALNYQESHNDNLYNSAAGDANWLMFDYNRGYAPDIESSGVMDIFRLPKFSYYFYSSQQKLVTEKPVLFIANYWNDSDYNDVIVYSNCDEVELLLNGKFIAKKKHDTDLNSVNLKHPPFTFNDVRFQKGTLTAKAFSKGKLLKKTSVTTPGNPYKLEISIDQSNKRLQAGCNDIVFVYAKITDKEGNFEPTATNKVTFKVEGDAELIGDNPVVAEAGIASILLRHGMSSGKLIIIATSNGLMKNKKVVNVNK